MPLEITTNGSGDPVLFIHGCPTSPDVLAPLAVAAARRHRAIQVALPGYGTSRPLAAPFAVSDMQAAIEEAVLPLIDGHPLAVVGFSAGAYHALALATRGRLLVRQVICLAGFMAQSQATRDGLGQFAAALRQGVDLRGVPPERFLSPDYRARHPDAVHAVVQWLDATPSANLANELDAFALAPDLDVQVAALDIPVLARVGSLDAAAGSLASQSIVAAAKKGTLEIAEGVGHALMYEDLERTTASVVAALGR